MYLFNFIAVFSTGMSLCLTRTELESRVNDITLAIDAGQGREHAWTFERNALRTIPDRTYEPAVFLYTLYFVNGNLGGVFVATEEGQSDNEMTARRMPNTRLRFILVENIPASLGVPGTFIPPSVLEVTQVVALARVNFFEADTQVGIPRQTITPQFLESLFANSEEEVLGRIMG